MIGSRADETSASAARTGGDRAIGHVGKSGQEQRILVVGHDEVVHGRGLQFLLLKIAAATHAGVVLRVGRLSGSTAGGTIGRG